MLRLIMAILLAVAGASVHGKVAEDAGTRIEASMLVTGSLVIEPDGSVSSHQIDRADEVPDYVRAYIGRAIDTWRFEPVKVDGEVVRAQVRMTLRMLATPIGADDFAVSLAGATFGDLKAKDTDHVSRRRFGLPKYPGLAAQLGASGTVYLVIRVDRDGRPDEIFVEQVNLRVAGDAETMERLRRDMADAATKAARRWLFTPPTTGELVDDPSWTVRVPVVFSMMGRDRKERAYAQWVPYVPGPRRTAPWIAEDSVLGSDAIADGALEQASDDYRLLSPLQPEG